ncbi:MAG: hypothetical protein M1828_002303 [Chrysothrix sp. TS-e1954]|nr:MAG: hypothetical protein M1828_002303 [Chrysothrix sp. TS-e1954]
MHQQSQVSNSPLASGLLCLDPLEVVFQEIQALGRGGQATVSLYQKHTEYCQQPSATDGVDDAEDGHGLLDNVIDVLRKSDYRKLPQLIAVKQAKMDSQLELYKELSRSRSMYDHMGQYGNHPNIAKVFQTEALVLGGDFYLRSTMEFYNCRNLEEIRDTYWRQGQRLQEGFIWHVFKEVAFALDWVHALNPQVVHRDVKPANIMLHVDFDEKTMGAAKFPRVLLTDFDMGCFYDPMNCSGDVVGTRGYQAPETRSGLAGYRTTPKSDVFSLGGVIQFLAGHMPPGALTNSGRIPPGHPSQLIIDNPDPNGYHPTGHSSKLICDCDHTDESSSFSQEDIFSPEICTVRPVSSLNYSVKLDYWAQMTLEVQEQYRPSSRQLVEQMVPVAIRQIAALGGEFPVVEPTWYAMATNSGEDSVARFGVRYQ